MGFRAINWAWKQRVGKPSAKLVLATLADYANDDGKCWPSLRTIETRTEFSRDSVLRAIRFLKSKNLLIVIRRRNGRLALSNIYQLNYNPERLELAQDSAELVEEGSSTIRLHGAKLTQSVVAQLDQGSSTVGQGVVSPPDPNHDIEPSIEAVPPPVPQRGTTGDDFSAEKKWINSLFGRRRAWSCEEDHLLRELLPIDKADRALLSWAYMLPRNAEGWALLNGERTSKPKQSLVALLREFASEIDKWRSVRPKRDSGGVKENGTLPAEWIPVIKKLYGDDVPIPPLKSQLPLSVLDAVEAACRNRFTPGDG